MSPPVPLCNLDRHHNSAIAVCSKNAFTWPRLQTSVHSQDRARDIDMTGKHDPDAQEREAKAALERVQRDSEVIGQSSLVRAASKARDHLAGADADQSDPAEVWGRRVGRGLSVIAVIVLLIWLVNWLTR